MATDRMTDSVMQRKGQPGVQTGLGLTRRKDGSWMVKYPVPFSAAIRGFREMTDYEKPELNVRTIYSRDWEPLRRMVELVLLKPFEPERREEGRELLIIDAGKLFTTNHKTGNWQSHQLYDRDLGDPHQPIEAGRHIVERNDRYIEMFAGKISRAAFAAIPGPINE